ncbi:M23 family metallopeptidase [Mycobacterium sp. Y57]|uniref:M23 family metallopeptidase n=1 Tax=Mycolicibacterium xanthum TaxID=2796469 RepID=UPI001C85E90A|nr:M23 family metallopeptidase [Mycolicibacterium xanthum]
MRILALVTTAALAFTATAALTFAAPARADTGRLGWPLRPSPTVVRDFSAPSPDWQRGHRGVDLAGVEGQPVYAAGGGTVVFSGVLAGRPLVSIAHPGGLRTSYEPVRPGVRRGQSVGAGMPIGVLVAGHPGCPAAACLHWGAMWGPAARADYVDPLGLLASTPIRLKPARPRRPCRPGGRRRTTLGAGPAGLRPAGGPGRGRRAAEPR